MDKPFVAYKILILLLSFGTLSAEQHLPTFLTPSHYSLHLTLDPSASTYNGTVDINFSTSNAVLSYIRLHAFPETIEIQSSLLNGVYTCDLDVDESIEIVTFGCPLNSIWANNTLSIQFVGTYGNNTGLYKSTFEDNGVENVLLATKFQTVAARRAFPCFDEPTWKATFDISITHPSDYNALANTPMLNQSKVSSDQTQTQFQTTPPMSTYLVAFVVSKFVATSDGKTRAYNDQVFSRPSVKNFTTVAAQYGPTLIDLLSNWTGILYTDLGDAQVYQVLIPDYEGSDLEDWGLIAFRESELLDEKNTTSDSAKQSIITTLARELSNQWFGDYVTLDWWSDAWLDEGLATYFQYYIPDQLEDNLETMNQFIINELQPILQVDADPLTVSLTSDVSNATEYEAKFSDLSHSKGSSLIRMLRNILGEVVFREGIQSYLTTYKYNNTGPSNFLNSFDTALGIAKIMNNYIYKPGFPLVTATLNGSTVILTQERFLFPNISNVEKIEWYIPISYTTSAEKDFSVNIVDWLDPNSTANIEINNSSWIILNIQQVGYYRVNYDETLWRRIIKAVNSNHKDIDVLNRAQLIDDAFNVARAGLCSYQIAFNLTQYLKSETDYYPWVSALNAFSYIFGKLGDDEAEDLLQATILDWIDKAFPKITSTGKKHIDKLKGVLILDWACKLGQKECISYAMKAFKTYKNQSSISEYNNRGIVFCYGFRNSTDPKEDYDFLLKVFEDSASVHEKNDVISSLGCTNDTDLLSKYLSETISENSSISKKDAASVYKAVCTRSNVGINVCLKFLADNLESIASRYEGTDTLSNLVLVLADGVASDDQISRLTTVIDQNTDMEEIKNVRDKAIEIITMNQNWTDAYAADIKRILENLPSGSDAVKPTLFIVVLTFSMFYMFYKR